jgi:hypothetical protein
MSIIGNITQGILGSQAEGKAERQRLAGIEEAKGYQTRGAEESKGYYNPYYQTGTAASNRLAELMGVGGNVSAPGYGSMMRDFSMADYQQDPGYQFRLQEGLKQLQGMASARGGLLSGATIRGGQKYAQNAASQEYGNAYDRYVQQQQNRYNMLRGQQQTGYQAGGAMADIANQYAANMGNLGIGAGNVRAASTLGKANAWSGAVSGIDKELQAGEDKLMKFIGLG